MNAIHDLFAETAAGAPAPDDLVRRVHERRRRTVSRRRTVAAFAGVVTLAATAAAANVARSHPAPVYVALGADGVARVGRGDATCQGFSERVPGPDVPTSLRLVSANPALRQVRPATARRMTSDCGTAAIALALVDVAPDGATRRRLTLSGPLPAPLTVGPDESHAVRMRGVTGRVVVVGGRVTAATWRDRDGRAWALQSTGNDEDAVLAYVNALDLPASGPARLPADLARGYRDLGTSPARDRGATVDWRVSYRDAAGHEVEVEASDATGLVSAFLAGGRAELSREVTVRGHRAAYFTNGDRFGEALQLLQWEESPGVVVMVSGVDLSLAELRALADHLRLAGDDEPVVTTAT